MFCIAILGNLLCCSKYCTLKFMNENFTSLWRLEQRNLSRVGRQEQVAADMDTRAWWSHASNLSALSIAPCLQVMETLFFHWVHNQNLCNSIELDELVIQPWNLLQNYRQILIQYHQTKPGEANSVKRWRYVFWNLNTVVKFLKPKNESMKVDY